MSNTSSDPYFRGVGTASKSNSEWNHVHRRISWGAILGAVVFVIAIQILLSALGAGIGLGSINVGAGTTASASTFGIGAGLWWVVTGCVALFAGGYAAAWLAGSEIKFDGMLHGLVVWSIATLVTIYLLTSAVGGIIGGGFSAMGGIASSASTGLQSAAAPLANSVGISPDVLQQRAQAYLKPTSTNPATMTAQDAQKEIAQNLFTFEQGGPDALASKQRIIDISAAQMKISPADAAKKFDEAQAKVEQTVAQTKQKATEVADATTAGASRTAFAVFVNLLLGAIAAAIGGAVAIQRRVFEREHVAPVRQAAV